jgi:hypothetical protein
MRSRNHDALVIPGRSATTSVGGETVVKRKPGMRRMRLIGLCLLAMFAVGSGTATASPGDFVAEVEFSQNCGSGIGVGVAYDGAGHLWVSCYASTVDLMRTNVKTGTVEQTYELANGIGALAYDSTRNALWAGPAAGTYSGMYYIQLDASKKVTSSKEAFELGVFGGGLDDGLAYDATDDTLYYSPDGSTEVHHYTTTGELLESRAWDGTECYNSGLAIGGELLFEGADGCNHVYVVNKKTHAAAFDFSTATESDPNHRDEGLSCDPLTFASSDKQVMWSKEAYSPNRAIAFEIPAETCGFGGKLPKATELSTTLSGASQTGENITVPEGTPVKDAAKLTGANVAEATGKVTYKVYSDSECTKVVASPPAVTVSGESVPPSEEVTLSTPGTYYWTALYEGDENNEPSESKCGAETATVEGGPTETITTTSLSGGGQSGPSITVSEGTAVTDQATVTGTNAGSATGTVNYKVYSDNECKTEVVDAGTVTVSGGSVPASNPESLAQGTYYWQATYSGDGSLNEGSQSKCETEVETVGPPPPPPCTKVDGYAKVVIHKEFETEKQKVENKLSTKLTDKQKLVFTWENGASKLTLTKLISASCVVEARKKKFIGTGEVTVNGEAGWVAKFKFTLNNKLAFSFHIRVTKPKEEPFAFTIRAAGLTTETFS